MAKPRKGGNMGPRKQLAAPAPETPSAPVRRDANEQKIPPPLEKISVDVDSRPRPNSDGKSNKTNVDHSNKIDESLGKEIRKAIDGAKDDGHKKQLDAAQKKAEHVVKEQVDPATITEVKVKVSGEVGGKKIDREFSVTTSAPDKPPPASKS